MSVKSKLKSAVKAVTSTVSNAVKNVVSKVTGKSQSGAVLNAVVPKGTSIAPKPYVAPKATGYVSQTGTTFYGTEGAKEASRQNKLLTGVASPSPFTGKIRTDINLLPSMVAKQVSGGGFVLPPIRTSIGSTANLGKASAPNDPSMIDSGIESLNFSSNRSSVGSFGTGAEIMGSGTATAGGAVAGAETAATQTIQSAKELEAEQAKLSAENAQKEGDNFLKKLFNEKENQVEDLAQKKQDLEEQYKIQERTAEINSLQESLSKMEVEVANQIAQTKDVLGSNNFINNQIQQIERNASPALNRLRADINFKTGILTQNEGLIEKAMEQATQESRDRIENLKWFYTEHYDKTISKLDKRYDNALQATIKEAEDEHDYQVKLWEWKRDTIIKYGLDGLTPNDSESVISRSAAKKEAVSGKGVELGSAGFANAKVEAEVRGDVVDALYNLQLSPDDAYKRLRTAYSPKEVTDETLKNLLGVGVKVEVPQQVVEQGGEGFFRSLYNSLFN